MRASLSDAHDVVSNPPSKAPEMSINGVSNDVTGTPVVQKQPEAQPAMRLRGGCIPCPVRRTFQLFRAFMPNYCPTSRTEACATSSPYLVVAVFSITKVVLNSPNGHHKYANVSLLCQPSIYVVIHMLQWNLMHSHLYFRFQGLNGTQVTPNFIGEVYSE